MCWPSQPGWRRRARVSFVDLLSIGGAPMKQIALLSFFAILALVAFALNTAPASDRGATAQINTQELTLNAKNLVDNTVAEPF
jgi:hypothetical protein